jgi:hypothetical protein
MIAQKGPEQGVRPPYGGLTPCSGGFDPGEHLKEGRLVTQANGEAIIRILNQLADELTA